nr:MAG TPA: hypothetical protein [Caudoviricetes sp.]
MVRTEVEWQLIIKSDVAQVVFERTKMELQPQHIRLSDPLPSFSR